MTPLADREQRRNGITIVDVAGTNKETMEAVNSYETLVREFL